MIKICHTVLLFSGKSLGGIGDFSDQSWDVWVMYIHGPLKEKEIHRFYSRSIIKNGINFLMCLTCVTFFLSRGIVMQKCFYVTLERKGLWTFTGTHHKFNLLTLNISISSSPFFVCHTFVIIVIWEFGVWLKNHLLVIFPFTLITCVHDIVLKFEKETHSWVWKGHQTNETS